jgi:hypothetical protein
LRPRDAPAKAQASIRSRAMIAIGVILIFLVAFGALNFIEFGRLD